jgi:hypothetical protein
MVQRAGRVKSVERECKGRKEKRPKAGWHQAPRYYEFPDEYNNPGGLATLKSEKEDIELNE